MPCVSRPLLLLLPLLALVAATQEVPLQAPLSTVVRVLGTVPAGDLVVRATVEVPEDAPGDLGVGAFVGDRHRRWFQRLHPIVLTPGRHQLEFDMGGDAALAAHPDCGAWNAAVAAQVAQAGLFLWSASSSTAVLRVEDLVAEARPGTDVVPRLVDLSLDQASAGGVHLRTGVRWQLSVLPEPFPANPHDADEFTLDAVFTGPGGEEVRIPGFACEPMRLIDRGDRQTGEPDGPCRFLVRWRPGIPGTWTARLEARWSAHGTVSVPLPPLTVAGDPWDGHVHVDAGDRRFFSVAGQLFWPIGINLHSTFDVRSRDRLRTVLTPERGTLAYAAMLRRLAAAGGNATEVWMSSWNLALEWNATWPGFAGLRRYNQFHAAKLDVLLDDALANGVRVNLVVNNHGQAAPDADREWKDNPWNSANGGPLAEPYALFVDPRALAGQANLRRYLVARYADHPAILGWKLWSEINLTAVGDRQRRGGGSDRGLPPMVSHQERLATLVRWHGEAAAHLHAIDAYRHPVTTHWSGDYRKPNPEVCALPGIDYLCIDAYHGGSRGVTLIDLLYDGMHHPTRGLGRFGKPLLVTEFGGTSQGAQDGQLAAELASAPWAALVSGNAGMPFTWWFEWVDQGGRWQSCSAIARFISTEDLRGEDARTAVLGVEAMERPWARAWVRRGRMLGYLADHAWAGDGRERRIAGAVVRIGSQISAGSCRIEWWDADAGTIVQVLQVDHPGGALDIAVPEFARHIAFKLLRTPR
jgi:hypothetical protein